MYKQAIVARKDLEIGLGKLASQVAHASLGSAENADKKILSEWKKEGSKKVVLKVSNLRELEKLHKEVKTARLPHCLVRDAGLTQLKPGTVTTLGIGPVEEKKIDKITGKLKLL
jgi:PTH2 family peptidyl-tRNA hydrolase